LFGDIEYTVVMAWTPIVIACCIGDIEYCGHGLDTNFYSLLLGDIEYTVFMTL
jgi:hypothetical protein